MKLMSDHDLKTSDYKYLEMYDKYISMRGMCEKIGYIIAYLSEAYNISESSVKRIIKRLSTEVII